MAIDFEKILKTSWKPGLAVGAAALALAKLTPKIPAVNIQMATIDVRSVAAAGLDTGLATKLVGFLNGIVTVPGIVIALLAGILLVAVGKLVYGIAEDIGLKSRNEYERMTWVMLFGWIATTLVMQWTFKLPVWTTIAAMAIYGAIISVVVIGGASLFKLRLE